MVSNNKPTIYDFTSHKKGKQMDVKVDLNTYEVTLTFTDGKLNIQLVLTDSQAGELSARLHEAVKHRVHWVDLQMDGKNLPTKVSLSDIKVFKVLNEVNEALKKKREKSKQTNVALS